MKTIASSLTGPYTVIINLLARKQQERMTASSVSIVDGVYVITTPKKSVFTCSVNAVSLSIFEAD